ncbi:hypothetical protein ACOSQ4_016396 [Xanthoceras sorbifolium]
MFLWTAAHDWIPLAANLVHHKISIQEDLVSSNAKSKSISLGIIICNEQGLVMATCAQKIDSHQSGSCREIGHSQGPAALHGGGWVYDRVLMVSDSSSVISILNSNLFPDQMWV